jgi:hypothetical protein
LLPFAPFPSYAFPELIWDFFHLWLIYFIVQKRFESEGQKCVYSLNHYMSHFPQTPFQEPIPAEPSTYKYPSPTEYHSSTSLHNLESTRDHLRDILILVLQ